MWTALRMIFGRPHFPKNGDGGGGARVPYERVTAEQKSSFLDDRLGPKDVKSHGFVWKPTYLIAVSD